MPRSDAALDRKIVRRFQHVLDKTYNDPTSRRRALTRVGIRVSNEVKKELSKPGGGRTYTRRGVTHQASAPGEPPAVDTGRLRSSYTWEIRNGPLGSFVVIGTGVEYAPHLEFGTSRMAARPHLRNVVEREVTAITHEFRRGFEAELRRNARNP